MSMLRRGQSCAISRTAAAVVFLVSIAVPAMAGTFKAFGPRNYVRGTGSPEAVRELFQVKNTGVPFRLRVENGGPAGDHPLVSSAIITLNGVEIFQTSDFNHNQPTVVERSVTPRLNNELTVELRGSPGGFLTVSLLGEDTDAPILRPSIAPTPNGAGWNRGPVTVSYWCSDITSEVVQCPAPRTFSSEGANQTAAATIVDQAGNATTSTVTVNIDSTPVALTLPVPPAIASPAPLPLHGTFAEALSGLNGIGCNGTDASVTGTSFDCTVRLAAGTNAISIRATDVAGNETLASLEVIVDGIAPVISLTSPGAGGTTTSAATFTLRGRVVDDHQVAIVTLGGTPLTLLNGEFTAQVNLAEGPNLFAIAASDRAGNTSSASVTIHRFSVPTVAIASPADLDVVQTATVTVTGTSAGAASVRVNGVAAAITGGTWRADNVPLEQGRTVITATATSASGHVATATVFAYRDAIPPRIAVSSPADGSTVQQTPIDVSGMVDDIVVGTINAGQATITVNGSPAEVSNRAFLARNVTLAPGLNTLTIVATDQGGNHSTVTSRVTYDAAAQARILLVSGDGQRAPIGTTLPLPLVVRLVNAAGSPVPGRPVAFEVAENNGSLTAGLATSRLLTAVTSASGEASVQWHLGTRAGSGNNRVIATAAGFAGTARFDAVATSAPASTIVIDAGSNQIGATGAPLPRPLIAAVIDSGNNRIAGVPVTFSVVEGGGKFGGQSSVTVTTDSDGRAWATPTLGDAVNTFVASLNGGASRAAFTATGKPAGPAELTRISGVVLDNQNAPIAGVSIRVEGTTQTTQTNGAGQFTIANAPVGYVRLIADGSTAQRPGTWPTLEYAVYTIPGQNNTLEMPVYLLPVDVQRGILIDETTGGTLTIPEMPGFALTIAAGSATFPGGSRTGVVSATLVHSDKVPMAPGFGQQPRFIVTIQPAGVHFDPPAALRIPNADGLMPGEVTEMYSFDHDLGQFVSIGTGSVSEDGSVIASDPGVGIIKGGWHCGGNPATSGASADCPECAKCDGETCIPDPAKQDQDCEDDGDNCTADICDQGHCQHLPATVNVTVKHPAQGPLNPEGPALVAVDSGQGAPWTEVKIHKVSPAKIGGQFKITLNTSTIRVRKGTGFDFVANGDTFDATVDTYIWMDATGVSQSENDQSITIKWTKNGKECPNGKTIQLTAVHHRFDVTLTQFIPYQWAKIPLHPFYIGIIVQGDDRGFDPDATSFRVRSAVTVAPFKAFSYDGLFGTKTFTPGKSVNYDKATSVTFPDQEYSPANRLLAAALNEPHTEANKGAPYMTNYGFASTYDMHIDPSWVSDYAVKLHMHGAATDPIVIFAADIDWIYDVTIDCTEKFRCKAKLQNAEHDGFPAHEIYVWRPGGTKTPLLQWMPPPGNTVLDLLTNLDYNLPDAERDIP